MVGSPLSITFYTGITTIISVIIIVLFINRFDLLNINNLNNKSHVFIMEAIEVIAALLLRYANLNGNVVIITSITSCSVVVAIIISKVIFKDNISKIKWLIIIFIVILIILLSIL